MPETQMKMRHEVGRSLNVAWPKAVTDPVLRKLWQENADRNRWDWSWRFNSRVHHFLNNTTMLYGQSVEVDNELDDFIIYAGRVYARLQMHTVIELDDADAN